MTSKIKNNEMGWNRRKEKWTENFKVHVIRTNFLMWSFASDLYMIAYLYMYTQLLCELCSCIINMIQKLYFFSWILWKNYWKWLVGETWQCLSRPAIQSSASGWGGSKATSSQCFKTKASIWKLEAGNAYSQPLFPMQTIYFPGLCVGEVYPPSRKPTPLRALLLPVSSIPPTTQWLSK